MTNSAVPKVTPTSGPTSIVASHVSQYQLDPTSESSSTYTGVYSGVTSVNQPQSTFPETPTSSKRLLVDTDYFPSQPVSIVEQPLTVNELEDPGLTIASVADVAALREYVTGNHCTCNLQL